MGSHYFSRCRTDERFTSMKPFPIEGGGEQWLVYDWDQRRAIDMYVPVADPEEGFLYKAAEKFFNDLPPNVVKVEIGKDGTLLSSSSDSMDDRYTVPFYPPRADFPEHVATVRRGDLTEVDRLGLRVDLTRYSLKSGETRDVVFKYYFTENDVVNSWHEANCVMRIPTHPNIVPFDALVTDTIGGVESVVGFTTRYIPGGTLSENKGHVFKLKYLRQLIDVVDFLNLRLGIVHGDICPWNLLIDPTTDDIRLFDFNGAAKLGWEGDKAFRNEFRYEKDSNDVKFVIFTLYEIITREFCFRSEFYPYELDASKITRKRKWAKHRSVKLDSPVDDYIRVLREWVRERAKTDKKVDHFAKASEPLNWPPLRVSAEMADPSPLRRPGRLRCTLIQLGRDFLRWERPPTRALPLSDDMRLLATGEVVRNDESSSSAKGVGNEAAD